MMRRLFAVAVAAATVFSVAGPAFAGTTIDVIFRNLGGGTLSNGGRSVSFTSAPASTVADVIMTTTDHLVASSISVQFDNTQGLQVSQAIEWVGLVVPVGKASFVFKPLVRGDGTTGSGLFTDDIAFFNLTGVAGSFDGNVPPPPNSANFSPAGTYNLGTVVWDLTSANTGFHSVAAFINPGLDGFGIIDAGGNVFDITGSQVLGSGGITIVPEPGTAALLGLGLVGLMVASRRRA